MLNAKLISIFSSYQCRPNGLQDVRFCQVFRRTTSRCAVRLETTTLDQLLQPNVATFRAISRHRITHGALESARFWYAFAMTSSRGRKWRRKSAYDVIVHAVGLLLQLRTLATALPDLADVDPLLPAEFTGKSVADSELGVGWAHP